MVLLLRMLAFGLVAVASIADNTATELSCDLVCQNDGYCTLVEGTPDEIARQAQAGYLVEVCVCRPGFTGVACETVVEECSLPERKCHNGVPCTQDLNGDWGCDCSHADLLSAFAGYQCRDPSTEYCSGKYKPDAALSFCTNGGRCEADFIAAKIAPGDTSLNQKYQHLGCRCPSEFYGPHCELLKYIEADGDVTLIGEVEEKQGSPATASLMAILSTALVALVFLIYKKKRQLAGQRPPREITIDVSSIWGGGSNGYNENRYNGRHISSTSENLRFVDELEDVHLA